MQLQIKKEHRGFVALIGVMFLSALVTLLLVMHVYRLTALDDQFSAALQYVRSEISLGSCQAVTQLLLSANSSYASTSSIPINFLSVVPPDDAITAVATSCATITP